jgi:glycosyltransferase involved in cell wall biosynthesis
VKLSYGITVHKEHEELNQLLELLIKETDTEDEIIIVQDGDDKRVEEVISKWMNETLDWKGIYWHTHELNGDFAKHKNFVIEQCSGDYIFHIDADEYPNTTLLKQLKDVLKINQVDLIWVPRVNTVEGITEQHIKNWGWNLTEQGWVNYPDYQSRIFRRDENIRWQRPVHEQIQGAKTYSHLPPMEELSLYHPKTIEKQEKQNQLYSEILS